MVDTIKLPSHTIENYRFALPRHKDRHDGHLHHIGIKSS